MVVGMRGVAMDGRPWETGRWAAAAAAAADRGRVSSGLTTLAGSLRSVVVVVCLCL